MPDYIVEYDLLPFAGRQLPITRRRLIKDAAYIGEAAERFLKEVVPGGDCVSFSIKELSCEPIE